jgi:hypothetical protein
MPRIAVVLVAALVALGLGSQLLLPPIMEDQVANRLERDGGSATVSLDAVPAVRLLFDDGDKLRVEGRGLRLDVGREGELDRLDGFNEVHVSLTDVVADPLRVRRFALTRSSGQRDYAMRMAAVTTPRAVARFLGGPLGDLGAGLLPGGGDNRVPLEVEATVRSHHGRREVTSASGSVAGIPAGPIAQLVVDAVVRRL